MRALTAVLLIVPLLSGCIGAAETDSEPGVIWDNEIEAPLWDYNPEPLPAEAGPCDQYGATHSATAPYHDNGGLDYCSSPWDPVALTGYDERYRPMNDRTDGSPYGVHLSFADDPQTTLTVTWFTAGFTVDVEPKVLWGTSASDLSNEVAAATEQAYPGDPAVSDRNPVDVATHSATITGLAAGQTIWYKVSGLSGDSPVYDAHTDPGPDATVKVHHWGDQAIYRNESKRTVGFALEHRPDLIVIAGDLSYANGVQEIWDDYFWYFEPLFARVPVMAVVGNHENKGGDLFDGFRTRMTLPNDELQYGFQYGAAHWTMIDTEGGQLLRPGTELEDCSAGDCDPETLVMTLPDSPQSMQDIATFLGDGYAAKQAGDLSWNMAVQHVPVCSNHNSRGNAYQLQVLLDPLFAAFELDMLMVGHNHMYERSVPLWQCERTTEADFGYVEIINGGGGQSLYEFAPEDQFQSWSAAHAARTTVVEYVIDKHELYGYTHATDLLPMGEYELVDAWEIELE